MERMVSFDIARKLVKPDPRTKGLILKSLTGNRRKALMQVSTGSREGNDRMRAACDDFRLRTAKDISCTVRGKSVEVSIDDDENALMAMMDFSTALPLVQEDVLECFAFVWRHRGACFNGAPYELFGAACDDGAFRISLGIICPEETPDDEVFSHVMAAIEPFGMGLVKSGL